MSALSRLEDAGIQVVSILANCHQDLTKAFKSTLDEVAQMEYKHSNSIERVEIAIHQWTMGKNPRMPPTWRALYEVLNNLGHKELSQEVEEYLTS